MKNIINHCPESKFREICIKWSTNDILEMAKEMDYNDMNLYEANIVLESVEHGHDAEIGINWDVIKFHIQEYYDNLENDDSFEL